MKSELKIKWDNLKNKLSVDFSEDQIIDLDSIIFLIGLQELGQFQKRLYKQRKMEVIHIAVCKLLSEYGYYEFDFKDEDGWPHYQALKKAPQFEQSLVAQERLLKRQILKYFSQNH